MSIHETIEAASRLHASEQEKLLRDFAISILVDPDAEPVLVVEEIQRRVRATWGEATELVMCTEQGSMTSWCAIDTLAGTDDKSPDRFIQVGPKLKFTFSVAG